MAPNLTEDEIDDLIFFARSGENKDLQETLSTLASREQTSASEILVAAKEEGSKTTCLHMATGNGHLGMQEKVSASPVLFDLTTGRSLCVLTRHPPQKRNGQDPAGNFRGPAQGRKAGVSGHAQ